QRACQRVGAAPVVSLRARGSGRCAPNDGKNRVGQRGAGRCRPPPRWCLRGLSMTSPLTFLPALKLAGLCLRVVLVACTGRNLLDQQAGKAGLPPGGFAAQREEKKELLKPGMTKADVRRVLGPPRQVSRQILYHRYLEQWHYGQGPIEWIEFDC